MAVRFAAACFTLALITFAVVPAGAQQECSKDIPSVHRNVIIFVADGLRPRSVNKSDTRTLWRVQRDGVSFIDSHALYPTVTTANASALATAHALGDTGDFANVIWTQKAVGVPTRSVTPFLEDDRTLRDLYARTRAGEGSYMAQQTLLAAACKKGYNTASIGKLGPTAIQAISELPLTEGDFGIPHSIIVDDLTGWFDDRGLLGPPVNEDFFKDFQDAKVSLLATQRGKATRADNGYPGNDTMPGTFSPNLAQVSYFTTVLTRVVLPRFQKDFMNDNRPFVLVFWSRDPDGTQHNQGDSPKKVALKDRTSAINGPTSKSAVKNVDDALEQVLKWIDIYGLTEYTDVIVVADHGFSTISKQPLDGSQKAVATGCSTQMTIDQVPRGFLPPGFLAIDIAHRFKTKLYDPNAPSLYTGTYRLLFNFDSGDEDCRHRDSAAHPTEGNGLIGGSGRIDDESSSDLIVAANGGSDLIYMPRSRSGRISIEELCAFLRDQNYVDGLFVDDQHYKVPAGTLGMSEIGLTGRADPRPAIVVNFKSFSTVDSKDEYERIQNMVEIADSDLQQGQGMHGSFSRADTWNYMAAIGPHFKSHYVDHRPVSNMDVAQTVATLLGLGWTEERTKGRTLYEALAWDPPLHPFGQRHEKEKVFYGMKVAKSDAGRYRTVVLYQRLGDHMYYDEACFTDRTDLNDQESGKPLNPSPCLR